MTEQADDAYLTVKEAAGVWRVNRMTVYRAVWAGTVPSSRVGRSIRIPVGAVLPQPDPTEEAVA